MVLYKIIKPYSKKHDLKIDLKDTSNWIPKDVFESYCGDKSEKLLSFYDKALDKKQMNTLSLNWMAILVLPAWLGYRRQWVTWAMITIILTLLPFFEAIVSYEVPNTAIISGLLVAGILANSLLLTNAQNQFSKLKRDGLEIGSIKSKLRNKVTPSIPTALLGFLGNIAFVYCGTLLAEILFGLPY